MHLGIVCPELMGHLNPMLSLGRALQRRGHRVSVIASPQSERVIRASELEYVLSPSAAPDGWDVQEAWRRVGEQAGLRAFLRTFKIFRRSARWQRQQLPELLDAFAVEGLIVDQFSPAAAIVADEIRMPFVVACNALVSNRDLNCPPPTMGWKYRPNWFGRLRNWAGYKAGQVLSEGWFGRREPGFVSPLMLVLEPEAWGLAQLSQQPSFFDFPRLDLPNHFHYTGPWHEAGRDPDVDFPWERLDGRPLVYASLGTLQNRLRHVYEAIVESVRGLDVQLVLALGSRDARLDVEPADNAIVVPYAPQLRLLDRAAATITHAGLNTALECLARGVPMVCVPVTNDQPGVARRVEWLGAGLYLAVGRATAGALRTALQQLLAESAYRTAAEQARDAIARTDGLGKAVGVIEEAFATRRRVRSS